MSKSTADESAANSGFAKASTTDPDHKVIAEVAYQLWILRARPIGSPEVDWYRAEQELKNTATSKAAA